ncbi:hypothetical protein B9Z19DRAFT_1110612 [Tuber borchii]|uniref:Uncharacterized protein n=1 Tax=Tuber borchii TaxID=42251 RepID=A0A2T6ZG58_TUBBO|nr:hypothetical protein B9Z19DRAFT_1110612 [Tuber borchii]
MPSKRKVSPSDDFRTQCEIGEDFVIDKGSFTLDRLPEKVRELQVGATEHQAEIESLMKKVALLETQSVLNRRYIASLEDDVTGFTQSLEAYKITRHQFISMFKQSKLKNPSKEDLALIAKGNVCSVGDALVDAELYKGKDGRHDWYSFEQLYGFPPPVVESFTHPETIDLLNKYATVIASKKQYGSNTFYENFAAFIDLFKKSNYDEGFLWGEPTAVTSAYWVFVKSCEDEVQKCA